MREPLLAEHLNVGPAAGPDRRSRPLADAVDREDCGLFERRWIECRGRVRLVVLAEEDLAAKSRYTLPDIVGHPELVAQPDRQRRKIRAQTARSAGRVRLDEPIELDQGLLVEADEIEIGGRNSAFPQAIFDRALRKARIVLLAGESLFLSGSDNAAVLDQARRRI